MPGSDLDAADDRVPPHLSAWQRLVSALPHLQGNPDREPLGSRLRNAVLKPVDPDQNGSGTGPKPDADGPTSVGELEAAIKRADDKERLIGLLAAPIAGMIGLLVTGSLLANDPSAFSSNGRVNAAHVNPSLYLELGAVAVGLAVVMLAMAWFRKRLYLGITMALYGLSIFNLHFWGFGLPYILAGAWLLVRAFRLQSKLKLAKAAEESVGGSSAIRSGPNKRYTPPTSPPGRSSKPKPGNERKAG